MKKLIIIIAIALFMFLLILAAISNNIYSLCVLASASGQSSALHNYFMERIYKIAEKEDISNILIDLLKKDNKNALHGLCLRILGVTGERKALNDFMLIYYKHQNEEESLEIRYVLDYIGLLGDQKVVVFLEKIINMKGQWELLNFPIARSLYLLTGKKYSFIDPKGGMQEFYTTDEVIKAREVILASKDRKRTFREMVILDNLFRM